MADHLSSEKRSWNMSRIRSKNTTPELIVRRILTNQGLRYRLHVRSLPGNPDIVIRRKDTALFINGCFWHQHKNCKRSNLPKSNMAYWVPKLERNVTRQKQAFKELRKLGLRPGVVWECETKDETFLKKKLEKLLNPAKLLLLFV
jgi:DNA mismatch endonuclease (patch repair protein)